CYFFSISQMRTAASLAVTRIPLRENPREVGQCVRSPCMLRSAICLPVAGSQSRTTLAVVFPFRSSSPATARTFPSGEKARLWSKQVGPLRVNRSSPVATSHNFTFGSLPALAAARGLPSGEGENATARTWSGDLPKVASSFPVSTSHTLAVLSLHSAMASFLLSAEKARDRARDLSSWSTWFVARSHSLTSSP